MRAYVTGGTGFVGSNIVKVFAERHGADVHCPVNNVIPSDSFPATIERLNLLDSAATRQSVADFAPDVIVHSMILNDFELCYSDRTLAWRSYVGTTETLAEAAAEVGAKLILVSTDWVFDGTQAGADENTPPNPVNLYGVLKLASEMATLARGGTVARVSAVSGTHWARTHTPRRQDGGFGYFVTSLVDALGSGDEFAVWESNDINMVASPSLASECAEVMWRIAVTTAATGIFHCCGADSVGRMELARNACDVFGFDPAALRSSAPDEEPAFRIPFDTSLSVRRTAKILDYQPPGVRELLDRFRQEHETGALAS